MCVHTQIKKDELSIVGLLMEVFDKKMRFLMATPAYYKVR